MEIALVEPEIPPNTGSVARLCAATGTSLHLIGKLGFSIDDRHLKRAGLDYWPEVDLSLHHSWKDFRGSRRSRRFLAFSARAATPYTAVCFRADDVLVFGSESRGLPAAIWSEISDHIYTIPINNPAVRSLNLANAVAVVMFEAIRQIGYPTLASARLAPAERDRSE